MTSANCWTSMLQSAPYFLQRRPPGILHLGRARTLFLIQILAALRTQSLAILAARDLQRQGQQQLLAQYILKQQPFALIIADLSFSIGHRELVASRISA